MLLAADYLYYSTYYLSLLVGAIGFLGVFALVIDFIIILAAIFNLALVVVVVL